MEAQSAESNATASIPYVRGLARRCKNPTPFGRQDSDAKSTEEVCTHAGSEGSPTSRHTIRSGVRAGCKDCRKIYIGETARTAKKRTDEHLNNAKKGNTEMSAVAQHTLSNNHTLYWKPRVVLKESNTRKRKIREALTFHRFGAQTINQDKGTNLS